MATLIYCSRVAHHVVESRTEVGEALDRLGGRGGFVFFTRSVGSPVFDGSHMKQSAEGHQVALNSALISSFEAVPGDPV